MKKQFTILLFVVFGLFSYSAANCQNYDSALGIRAGFPLSISYKNFVSGSNAIELYAGWRGWPNRSWFSVNGAYLVHHDLEGVKNLQWYYGAGVGIYFWNFGPDYKGDTYANTTFSVQGYLGLDFTIDEAPLNFTLDWVPTLFFNGYNRGFGASYGSLGIRYVLAR